MDYPKILFKKIDERAKIPQYQTDGASGFDLYTIEDVKILPKHTALVRTGLIAEIKMPDISSMQYCGKPFMGVEIQIRPRGGISYKTSLRIANTPGTVDMDYRGELMILVENTAHTRSVTIDAGTRIAQAVLAPVIKAELVEVTEALSETERGDGCLGSTGLN